MPKAPKQQKLDLDESEDDFGSSDDDYPVVKVQKKTFPGKNDEVSDEEDNLDEDQDEEGDDLGEEEEDDQDQEGVTEDNVEDISQVKSKKNRKLKKLTPEQLAKEQKKIKKTGVCYLSRIPPYMKPSKLRSIMSRFGELDRIFLKPEDAAIYRKRVKYGGNKKKNYTEGWVEFVNKKDAKLCEATLNGNKIGGKKTSYYYDDIMNVKYLSGFKWFDLTQQISKENEVRQAKLTLEISQQHKLNKSFMNNLDQSKMIKNIEKKRKPTLENVNDSNDNDNDQKIRRNFKQRNIASTRADASSELKKDKPSDQLNDVLSKVF